MSIIEGFNPHTHAGCDYDRFAGEFPDAYVSIHTPTQGVTSLLLSTVIYMVFQSTHPRRV